jgi:hypothetical protein
MSLAPQKSSFIKRENFSPSGGFTDAKRIYRPKIPHHLSAYVYFSKNADYENGTL